MANKLYCRKGHFNGYLPENTVRGYQIGRLRDFQEREYLKEVARLSYCPTCGAENINACLSCETTIEDDSEWSSDRPSFCGACGKPFPWTETALASAREYTDELEDLSAEDKVVLKGTFDDLVVYTPRTEVAVSRFKRILKKAGSGAGEVLTKIFVDLTSETIAKMLKG